jgi:hypothetical protein
MTTISGTPFPPLPLPLPPPPGTLPRLHIGGRCGGKQSNAIPWSDLQMPATNGRRVGVGGGIISLWSIDGSSTSSAVNLRNPTHYFPGVPGKYDLILGVGAAFSASGALLACAEYGGTFSSGASINDSSYKRAWSSGGPHLIARDGADPYRFALWTGDGSGLVRIVSQDLSVVSTCNISHLAPAPAQVVQIGYHQPNLVVVIFDPASGTQSIKLVNTVTGAPQRVAQALSDVEVTLNGTTVVWSQSGWGSATHLFYWQSGFAQGGQLLFTPEPGYDLKFPQFAGRSIVFARRWPGVPGAQRKIALLAYDLGKLRSHDPTVCEITDTAIWNDTVPLHGVFRDPRGGDTYIAHFQHPSPASIQVPHLALTVFP